MLEVPQYKRPPETIAIARGEFGTERARSVQFGDRWFAFSCRRIHRGNTLRRRRALAFVAGIVASASSFAGRPLTVDDAGTNATGEGHVEVWVERVNGTTSVVAAPAYAFAEGLELSAALARETTHRLNGSVIQLKWLITPSKEDGCNVGTSFGGARTSGGGSSINASFLNGLLSCNGTALGNVHLNLGTVKPSGQSGAGTWGIALEREFGAVTPHIEWFGAEGSKPTVQIGARTDIAKTIQLDGTVGRTDGNTQYSLGLKFKF